MSSSAPKRSQAGSMGDSGKNGRCRKSVVKVPLSAEQAQALHEAEGDGCWKPSVCYSRRSDARHRDRINQTRSCKRKEGELEQIPVDFEPLAQLVFGVLVIYRQAGVDTPVHAIRQRFGKDRRASARPNLKAQLTARP